MKASPLAVSLLDGSLTVYVRCHRAALIGIEFEAPKGTIMALYKGGCSCGSVRFELEGYPAWVLACHCNACKKRTGSAYGISVMVDNATVKQFVGETRTYTRKGDTGSAVHYDFCPKCGTTLRWRVDIVPNRQAFAGGAFDDMNSIKVVAEMCTDDALPWARLGCELSRPKATDEPFRNAMIAKTRSSLLTN